MAVLEQRSVLGPLLLNSRFLYVQHGIWTKRNYSTQKEKRVGVREGGGLGRGEGGGWRGGGWGGGVRDSMCPSVTHSLFTSPKFATHHLISLHIKSRFGAPLYKP